MDTWVVVVLLLVGAAYLFGRFGSKADIRSDRPHPSRSRPPVDYAVQQLDTVMKSSYVSKRLMNGGEYRVFAVIERHLKTAKTGQRVFSQVSLGEVLSADGAAYDAINSKRVDMLVINPFGMPEVAVEHQGQGHHGGNAAARDAVKKEALRRAGIPLVETFDTDSDEEILQKVFSFQLRAVAP